LPRLAAARNRRRDGTTLAAHPLAPARRRAHAEERQMKATDLLEKQHRLVEKLFAQFEDARSEQSKRDIFEKIAASLVAHDAIEREIFYPACEREMRGAADTVQESIVEHGLLAISIFRADMIKSGDLHAHVKVLRDLVDHHVEEEEGGLIPNANKKLSKLRNEALGLEMESRFNRAMREDFRLALRKHIEQILVGVRRARPAAPKRSVAQARAMSTTRARPKAARKRTTARRGAR
jgi:hemerythrin superfamily protein